MWMQKIEDFNWHRTTWGCNIRTHGDYDHSATIRTQRVEISLWGWSKVTASNSAIMKRQGIWTIPTYPTRIASNVEGWSANVDGSFVFTSTKHEGMPWCTINGPHGNAKDIGTCCKAAYWCGMKEDIMSYVKADPVYQEVKLDNWLKAGLLEKPMRKWA